MNTLQNEPKPLWKTILVLGAIFLVCGLPFLLAFTKFHGLSKSHGVQSNLPIIAEVPYFELTNQKEVRVKSASLKGKAWVADFIFTRCGGTCPAMTKKMKELKEKMPSLSLVSFTVDPTFDTPQILNQYVKRFELPEKDWTFLTGSKPVMQQISRGFKIAGAEEPVFHSNRFILIDSHNLIRGYYDPFDPASFEKLIQDIRGLAS